MRSRSRNSRRRSSHRSSRACTPSCCACSEQEQNLCSYCTRESRNSKRSSCCRRRLKCRSSNECNLKCQDKNTGVAKPLNVHLKLQLLNDRNQNKKSECLCAKYFQMLNACYGGPPLGRNLCRQDDSKIRLVSGEDEQMREKPGNFPNRKRKCNFFRKSKPKIEQTYNSSCFPQERPYKIKEYVKHADAETQTNKTLPSTCEDYVESILSPRKTLSIQNEASKRPDPTLYQISNTLEEITNTLQNIETKLQPEPKSRENINFATRRTSVAPTIVSFFTKCVPPPPLLTLSKLSCSHNPSPTIPMFPPQKTSLNCEEILKLFNFDGRNSFDFNRNYCVPKPDRNLMKDDVYTNEAKLQTNNNPNIL